MDRPTARLKLAVQKSGRLTENSLDLLVRCGLKYSRGKDQLMCYGENMPLDVLFVRDDDIPDLVQEDVCDLGIVGLQRDRGEAARARGPRRDAARFSEIRALDFGRCRLSLAVPRRIQLRRRWRRWPGKRIATTYPVHARALPARARRSQAEIVTLSGAVEIAPRLGRADLICDLVSTGSTLHANHLREVDTVLESQAALIRTPVAVACGKAGVGRTGCCCASTACSRCGRASTSCCTRRARRCRRSGGCCPAANRRRSFRSRAASDKVAVHAVCRENVFWETLESLKSAGASAMLVLPVEKMLA